MASAVNGKLENKSEVLKVEPLDHKDAKWQTLVKITYRDPEGTEREWESSERLTRPAGCDIDGVNIVAILHDPSNPDESPRLLLQKQWRPPANSTVIEIPGGLIDPNESAETCALRELKEECGYEGEVVDDDFGVSPVMFNDPGFCNTNLRMIHVTVDLSKPVNQNPQPQLEKDEFIETFSVPLTDLWAECRKWEQAGDVLDARVATMAEGIELAKRFKL